MDAWNHFVAQLPCLLALVLAYYSGLYGHTGMMFGFFFVAGFNTISYNFTGKK